MNDFETPTWTVRASRQKTREDQYWDMINVSEIETKGKKKEREKILKTEVIKRLSPERMRWVKFEDGNTKCILPSNVFVISDFSFNLLKGSKNKFVDNLEHDARSWLKNKALEYSEYSRTNKKPTGAFWDNIFNTYKEAGLVLESWDSRRRILDLDESMDRKIYQSRVGNIRAGTYKESNEVNKGDMDKLLEGLMDGDDSQKRTVTVLKERDSRVDSFKESKTKTKSNKKGNTMRIENVKNTIVSEVKELVNQSGAADIAFGRILYNNIKSAVGKTVVKISFIDRAVAKVSKRMKYKNEVTELISVLTLLVILKQFYDHKALENVRGYAVHRLYTIGIEATGFDDVLALITQAEAKASIND